LGLSAGELLKMTANSSRKSWLTAGSLGPEAFVQAVV
jgi:hypothetical protein